MLKQQHYTLTKVENVQKHNRTPLNNFHIPWSFQVCSKHSIWCVSLYIVPKVVEERMCTFSAWSGVQAEFERSSCSTKRCSWESSSNIASMFKTNQANHTLRQKKNMERDMMTKGCFYTWFNFLVQTRVWLLPLPSSNCIHII